MKITTLSKLLFLLIPFLAAADSKAEITTVELKQGGIIKAEVITEKKDRVFLDLGFEVIAVPKDAILRMTKESIAEEAVGALFFTDDLYRTSPKSTVMPIRDLAEKNGGGVVLVRTPTGLGSGFVINPDGYVVTNDHVVAGEREISITVYEEEGNDLVKQQYENVRIVATSPDLDLALLKIENADRSFVTVPLGESDELQQGQTVFAIGNPLGLERTVSEGIVSIKNRLSSGRLYIQTTTQINPGNSGGPLFNMKGEVVGVNNMKIVSPGAEGLGFAIPSSVLKQFLKNRDAFAFDPRNPNAGFRYNAPPRQTPEDDASSATSVGESNAEETATGES